MTKTIEQSVRFPASARKLYEIYIDPKRHAKLTGLAVKISPRAGSAFLAFDGMLRGVTLATIPGQMIVQRWRSRKFYDSDPDSILILRFTDEGKRGRIDLAHVHVPKQIHAGIAHGWKKHYWTPLRKYLKN